MQKSMQHSARREPARMVRRAGVGLGWFSVKLGLMELLRPRLVAQATGLKGMEGLIRLYGLRELAVGIGLLAARERSRPLTPWVSARIAGDLLDLATLAARFPRGRRRTWVAFVAVAAVTALDVAALRALQRRTSVAHDYSRRSGLPQPADAMRGAAREEPTGAGTAVH